MSEKNLVPKRRFKGFQKTRAWELRSLGDVATFVNGRAYKQNELLDNGRYRVLRVGNFYTNREWYWSNMELDEKYYAENGDLLYTWSATFGPHIWDGEKVIYHYHIWKVVLSDQLVKRFAVQLMEYDKAKITSDKNGSTMVHITKKGMEEKAVAIPPVDEQRKIGEFLDKIDNLITLHQRKLEKTKALKSAYLAEMFPVEGEQVPKRRFAGFTKEWEKCKLKDLAEIVRGASPRPIQDPKWFDKNSNIGWLRISDVTEQNGRINYLKQRLSILGQEKTRVLNEPHLLLSIAATVGKPVVNYVQTGVHDGFLIFMNPKFDREFMFQWLEMFRPMWNKYGQPGSQVNLNSDIVKEQMIVVPSIEEQEMISKFFKKLDDKIIIQQQKLDKLKAMKRAYLQEMFV